MAADETQQYTLQVRVGQRVGSTAKVQGYANGLQILHSSTTGASLLAMAVETVSATAQPPLRALASAVPACKAGWQKTSGNLGGSATAA